MGPLPRELQQYNSFAGAVSATSQAPVAAQKLLDALRSPRAIEVMKAQGMEPM